MPERDFWRDMCPRRLIALYDAHFGHMKRQRSVPTVGTGDEPSGLYTAISRMGGR